VIDVPERTVFLYRGLKHDRYTHVIELGEGETVALESLPESAIPVSELLP
jgi:hypothetical protein